MFVRIEGTDLPGRRCGPNPDGAWYENVHVGIRNRQDATELVAGDAPTAAWEVEITTRITDENTIDFGGPYVHGKPGERCIYLDWGTVGEDRRFTRVRAAKLRLDLIEASVLRTAQAGRLTGRLGLTDPKGQPRCSSVRPPDIVWSAG